MFELFRFNLKKNIGVFFNNKKNSVIKFGLTVSSKKKLDNELKGYLWYSSKIKKKKYFIISKKTNYIEFPLIKGKKFNFWDNFIFQKKKINKIFKHYKDIWPKQSQVPFHGDLTLDNIVFLNQDSVFFIDWENYKSKQEWGLDLCYFLISLIVLPSLALKQKKITQDKLTLFSNLWEGLFKNKKYKYLNDPINFLKQIIKEKDNFLFKISPGIKKQIDNIINV